MNITEPAADRTLRALTAADTEPLTLDQAEAEWRRLVTEARAALPHLQPTVPTIPNTVDAAMPERDGRYQGDDGEWAVRHRKTRVIRAMRDRGDAENEARLNPDVEVVRRTVTAWRAP